MPQVMIEQAALKRVNEEQMATLETALLDIAASSRRRSVEIAGYDHTPPARTQGASND